MQNPPDDQGGSDLVIHLFISAMYEEVNSAGRTE